MAALNDASQHRNSRDRRAGSYGNWNRTGTQWVQYDWTQAISTDKIELYWWDDRQGVRLPSAARLLYWDVNPGPIPGYAGPCPKPCWMF